VRTSAPQSVSNMFHGFVFGPRRRAGHALRRVLLQLPALAASWHPTTPAARPNEVRTFASAYNSGTALLPAKPKTPGMDCDRARGTPLQTSFVVPGASPSPVPGSLPSSVPGSLPSPVPGSLPSPVPGSLPSPVPGSLPSPVPGSSPSPVPGSSPSPVPGSSPSPVPGSLPSPVPGSLPSPVPGSLLRLAANLCPCAANLCPCAANLCPCAANRCPCAANRYACALRERTRPLSDACCRFSNALVVRTAVTWR
jgi:hypothetical protein